LTKKFYTHPEMVFFETGNSISDLKIAYHTFGTLNANKDNVIWICHALTANSDVSDWWDGLFGAGNIFDPEKYFIICANNIASPYGSTSPDSIDEKTGNAYGIKFPAFTIRDNAKCFILLKEALGIDDIHLLMGGSCGGNIALEMAIILKESIKNMVLLCSSAIEQPWTIAIHESQRMILENDPEFVKNSDGSGKVALKIARSLAMPFYRTAESFNAQQKEEDLTKIEDFKAAAYVSYQGQKLVDRFSPQCYYVLMNVLDTHNVGRGRSSVEEALGTVKAKTLCIGIESDLFVTTTEQKYIYSHIPDSKYGEIKSIYGHDAFLIEFDQIIELINSNIEV